MVQRRRVAVAYDDVSIDVILNEPEAPPKDCLVLLPSSSRDSEDFDDIADRFAAGGLRVLRPQPRGMRGSRGPMEALTLHDLARDVAVAMTDLNAVPGFILGHAFGQWVGRCVAADHPRLVKGVVLAAAAAKSANPALRDELARCVDTTLPDQTRLAALRTAFFARGHDPSAWLGNWHPRASAVQRAASAATPQEDWWQAGRSPVLDLQAEHDPWRPPETRDDIRRDLGAERVSVAVIADASHALIPEQPIAVVGAVLGWINALPAGDSHGSIEDHPAVSR